MGILLTSGTGMNSVGWVVYLVIIMVFMWLIMFRPQSKEQKAKQAMLNDLAIGDTILTTSGFYGVIIDIQDDTVIVEFGSNRNCRIPMTKTAISQVEKPEDALKAVESKDDKKDKKEKKEKK